MITLSNEALLDRIDRQQEELDNLREDFEALKQEFISVRLCISYKQDQLDDEERY